MANRLNNPNLFAALSPPWLLSQLDTNATQNQAAWNDSSLGFVNGIPIDTGTANSYTVALPFGSPSSYQDGMTVFWVPANTNTGASTLTVTPLGSVAVLTPAGNALQGGELAANRPVTVVYKSAVPTGFRIVGPCPLGLYLTGQTASFTVECAGYTSINLGVQWSGGSNLIVTLAHLAQGVPVNMVYLNNTGATTAFAISATNPAGTAFTQITGVVAGSSSGGATQNILGGSSGVNITNSFALMFTGGAVAPLTAYFSK